MDGNLEDSGSYHGMGNNDDEPISPNHPVGDRGSDREASKHPLPQGSVPRQLSRERSPVLDKFRQSQWFIAGVKDGSIVDIGIPRSKVQRQQIPTVLLANTPITGVGCLKARSSDIARRADPLYRMAYADKVKDL
ncbi:hypothetical protein H9Q72_005370 [Fusarium xylarioides]|uniref:Uncharacterized protein n=1 Tax=Fusarium xylarioides TaxID=221167 RepID=A0A9P7L2G4_9HYPO|nr:hypothetical protein H9Q72_005370 [Fusarium xylarioides]